MELSGDDANRWEQMSNMLEELSTQLSSCRELTENMKDALADTTATLSRAQERISRLSTLAYKEVLRQESATLNAEEETYNASAIVPIEACSSSEHKMVESASRQVKKTTKRKAPSKKNTPKQANLLNDGEEVDVSK